MSEPQTSPLHAPPPGEPDTLSMLFAQLVMQQANMAMMLMGKVKNPQTGQAETDLDAARLFIDMLEMLEVKTKGNLTKEESELLKQTLMSLRLSFVGVVESPQKTAPGATPPQPQPEPQAATPAAEPSSAAEEEHRKKFTKKY